MTEKPREPSRAAGLLFRVAARSRVSRGRALQATLRAFPWVCPGRRRISSPPWSRAVKAQQRPMPAGYPNYRHSPGGAKRYPRIYAVPFRQCSGEAEIRLRSSAASDVPAWVPGSWLRSAGMTTAGWHRLHCPAKVRWNRVPSARHRFGKVATANDAVGPLNDDDNAWCAGARHYRLGHDDLDTLLEQR